MLEGNRDEVLRLLENSAKGHESTWLRAQAALKDEERYELLQNLISGEDPKFAALAAQTVRREDDFTRQLDEPPDYKFWKQPTWEGKLNKMRPFAMWLAGGLLLLIFATLGISVNTKYQVQQESTIASIKATQTAVAFYNQTVAVYPAGRLQIIEIEYPTSRQITFGEKENDVYIVATPAQGATFAAIHFRFECQLALCTNPPESELQVLLVDGHQVGYQSAARPFLVEQPNMTRIAQGQSTDFWFVFEIPKGATPDAILVYSGESDIPQFINWINH